MKKNIYRKPVVKTIHVENHILSGSNVGVQDPNGGSGAAKGSTFMFDDIDE